MTVNLMLSSDVMKVRPAAGAGRLPAERQPDDLPRADAHRRRPRRRGEAPHAARLDRVAAWLVRVAPGIACFAVVGHFRSRGLMIKGLSQLGGQRTSPKPQPEATSIDGLWQSPGATVQRPLECKPSLPRNPAVLHWTAVATDFQCAQHHAAVGWVACSCVSALPSSTRSSLGHWHSVLAYHIL